MLNTIEDDEQDIARSSYADMLLDDERNHAYYMAIRANVNHLVKSPEWNPNGTRFFKCCDIGTGSGLLSMMCVQTFRDLNYDRFHVTAFEAFNPMAECAKKVIQANGMSEKITVVPTRAEDFGENPQFDLLVAELLDTELIGEGCLLTYRHALQNLCSPNCIFIPSEAHIYIQTLSSDSLWKRNDFCGCTGLPEIDDMQLSQAKEPLQIVPCTKAEKIFTFKFRDINSLKLYDHKVAQVGYGHIDKPSIAMWWDIVMYDEALFDKYLKPQHKVSFSALSCGPKWIRKEQYQERDRFIKETYGREVWREHWIQGVYYLRDCSLSHNFEDGIHAYHDSHSLWFTARETDEQGSCICGYHRVLSRAQISLWTQEMFGDKDVVNVVRDTARWYADGLANLLNPHLSNYQELSPIKSVTIICAQVAFKNLNRIRMRVGRCQGFDLSPLDDLIERASRLVDASTEPHHLIEYEFTPLGTPFPLVTLEASETTTTTFKHIKHIELDIPKSIKTEVLKKSWAIIFWPDFLVLKPSDQGTAILPGGWDPSRGPLGHQNMSENFKQLVHFLHDHPALDQTLLDKIKLGIKIDGDGISVMRDLTQL